MIFPVSEVDNGNDSNKLDFQKVKEGVVTKIYSDSNSQKYIYDILIRGTGETCKAFQEDLGFGRGCNVYVKSEGGEDLLGSIVFCGRNLNGTFYTVRLESDLEEGETSYGSKICGERVSYREAANDEVVSDESYTSLRPEVHAVSPNSRDAANDKSAHKSQVPSSIQCNAFYQAKSTGEENPSKSKTDAEADDGTLSKRLASIPNSIPRKRLKTERSHDTRRNHLVTIPVPFWIQKDRVTRMALYCKYIVSCI